MTKNAQNTIITSREECGMCTKYTYHTEDKTPIWVGNPYIRFNKESSLTFRGVQMPLNGEENALFESIFRMLEGSNQPFLYLRYFEGCLVVATMEGKDISNKAIVAIQGLCQARLRARENTLVS